MLRRTVTAKGIRYSIAHVQINRHGSLLLTRVVHAFTSYLLFAAQSKSVLSNCHQLYLVYVRVIVN